MKKIVALLLAAVMVCGLCACGETTPASTSTSTSSAETTVSASTETSTEPAPEPAAEQISLKMWCIATESDSNYPSYVKAIEEVTAAHPEINFEWEATENEAYKTKIKAAAAANELPDIFFTWGGAFLGDFVKADRVYCLDDAYKAFAADLPESMLDNTTYGGKHYGVPLTMNVVGLFANMDMLAEVGYTEVPKTYDELIDCCDKLVAAGKIPFGCSGKETWCVTEYIEPLLEKTIGAGELSKIFALESTWNNEDIKKAIGYFQEWIAKGYFDPSGISLGNDEVKNNFLQGKYAFYQNGTWNCGDVAGASFKSAVAEFPVIDSSKASLGQLIGGPSDTLAVAASSANPEVAANFTFELGRAICHYSYLAGSGLPSWKVDYETPDINPLTQAVAEICNKANGYVLFGDTAMDADTAQIYLDYVSQIYGSKIDGEGFVSGLTDDIG